MGLYNRFCKRFFAAVIIRLTAQSDSRALMPVALCCCILYKYVVIQELRHLREVLQKYLDFILPLKGQAIRDVLFIISCSREILILLILINTDILLGRQPHPFCVPIHQSVVSERLS